MYEYLNDNLEKIKEKIKEIKQKYNIDYQIYLIGVTKTFSEELIKEGIKLGINEIAENKVQELVEKFKKIKKTVKWHFIGHLQRNKVKYIIDKVDIIHSVDSISLAEEINKRAMKINKIQKIFLQINVSEEETKFGINCKNVLNFVEKIKNYKNIKLIGLMTIAPISKNIKYIRNIFKNLKKIKNHINSIKIENISIEFLSMGMSNDFELAIIEGSNMIRIGSILYGKRKY